MNFTNFHSLGNVIIPTDFHSIIFQRGGSTTNQKQLSLLRGHLARFRWDLHQGCNKGSVLENRLFGGEHGFYDFPYIGNVIIPTWQFKAELSWRVFLRWAQVDLLPSCASLPALWRLEVFGVSSTVWSVRFCIGFDAASKQQEKKQERLKTTQNLSWKLSLGGWTSIYHSISRKKLGAKQKKKPRVLTHSDTHIISGNQGFVSQCLHGPREVIRCARLALAGYQMGSTGRHGASQENQQSEVGTCLWSHTDSLPIGSMYAMATFTINIPPMLAYIPAPWILWVIF